jgi:hypothetical protein
MTTLITAVWNCDTLRLQTPEIRLGRLSNAVKQASRLMLEAKQTAEEHVQLLFTAPEYLFTAKGSHFMDEETKERVRGGLIALSGDYPQILLMPGSIGWYKASRRAPAVLERKSFAGKVKSDQRDLTKYPPRYAASSTAKFDFSFAPLKDSIRFYEQDQSNRQEWQTESLRKFQAALDKGHHEDLRIAKNTCFALHNKAIVNRYDKVFEACDFELGMDKDLSTDDLKNPILMMPGDHSQDFTHEDVTYGVELCSDHNLAGLRHWISKTRQPTVENVDIQVVMSASTQLEQSHCVARHFVIQADSKGARVCRANDIDDNITPAKEQDGISVFRLEW